MGRLLTFTSINSVLLIALALIMTQVVSALRIMGTGELRLSSFAMIGVLIATSQSSSVPPNLSWWRCSRWRWQHTGSAVRPPRPPIVHLYSLWYTHQSTKRPVSYYIRWQTYSSGQRGSHAPYDRTNTNSLSSEIYVVLRRGRDPQDIAYLIISILLVIITGCQLFCSLLPSSSHSCALPHT